MGSAHAFSHWEERLKWQNYGSPTCAGIQVNSERHGHGIAMTLVGCPLADFAKKHGYMDILPILCDADRLVTEAILGRLIRHNTVRKDRIDAARPQQNTIKFFPNPPILLLQSRTKYAMM